MSNGKGMIPNRASGRGTPTRCRSNPDDSHLPTTPPSYGPSDSHHAVPGWLSPIRPQSTPQRSDATTIYLVLWESDPEMPDICDFLCKLLSGWLRSGFLVVGVATGMEHWKCAAAKNSALRLASVKRTAPRANCAAVIARESHKIVFFEDGIVGEFSQF